MSSRVRKSSLAVLASITSFACCPFLVADGEESAGEDTDAVTIELVMEKTHEGKGDTVVKRAIAGTSREGELKQLLAYYLAMEKLEPPKGELASWKEKTAAVTDALISVLAEREEAHASLKNTLNCKACHTEHKGD